MQNTQNLVIETLDKIFVKYKDQGLKSLYLWGSVITDEFNENSSDIDSIGILEKDSPLTEKGLESEILKTGINEFHVRLISVDELSSTNPDRKNIITKIIHPRILLDDMPHWKLVSGTDYKISDFTSDPPTIEELFNLGLDKILKDGWDNLDNVQAGFFQYHLKGLLRLIHLQQRERGSELSFSIKNLKQNINEDEAEIIRIFEEEKKNSYDGTSSHQNKEYIDKFVNKLIKKYKA